MDLVRSKLNEVLKPGFASKSSLTNLFDVNKEIKKVEHGGHLCDSDSEYEPKFHHATQTYLKEFTSHAAVQVDLIAQPPQVFLQKPASRQPSSKNVSSNRTSLEEEKAAENAKKAKRRGSKLPRDKRKTVLLTKGTDGEVKQDSPDPSTQLLPTPATEAILEKAEPTLSGSDHDKNRDLVDL